MSDRLPFRRRSAGGKHVAARTARRLPVLVQGGVAVALAVGLGVIAVNPALGGPGDPAATGVDTAGAGTPLSATADLARARSAARDATREDLAQIADAAVAQVAQVRAKAQSAQLSAGRLAELDALRQQVDALVGQVEPRRSTGQVSRGGDRTAAEAGEAGGAPDVAPTAGTGSTPEPSDDVTPAAKVAPDAEPAPDAGPATGAGNDPAPATDPATDPGPATGPDPASDPGTDSDPAAVPSPAASDEGAASPVAAAPAGMLSALDVTDTATLTAMLPQVALDEDPTTSALRTSLVALSRTASDVDAAADAAQAATEAAAQAAQDAAAEQQRQAWADSLDGYPNGRIPASALCSPSFDSHVLLRCDAAQALDRLDAAYDAAFGTRLTVTDSYRSYGAQVTCRRAKGSLCARPGTSNHGWGLAVDFGGAADSFGTAAHDWLLANARTYGWDLPGWARADGSKPEPWHWEYRARGARRGA